MIPELGHFALILALAVALAQGSLPLAGAAVGNRRWMDTAIPAAQMQFFLIALSYACLTQAFIASDFSVLYVANNSNAELPLMYKISAVWGGHEGSLLLWMLILTGWAVAVTVAGRSIPRAQQAQILSVLAWVSIGFLAFILFTSNPFERLTPAPTDGQDLNPLLQDPGMAIHPPMLYMGYVGFAVPFAFVVAALLSGRFDAAWARWMRPWTTVAWLFLTLGIALGSWWAYYELGWGGWWFWDPVENASFLPWLAGTALIHSLAVTDKRGTMKAWTVLLAIFAFALSLLGTFLVRSGVLTSVHAFATDPSRGLFILVLLLIVVGGSLFLYALRAPALRSGVGFEAVSRETALLINNLLMVVAALTILLGTLYPIALDALGLGKVSVGPPYFNAVFVPLMLPAMAVMGVGMFARWKRDDVQRLRRLLQWAVLASVALAIGWVTFLLPGFSWGALLGLSLAAWVVITAGMAVYERVGHRKRPLAALATIPRGFWGMQLAHIGVAVFAVGVSLVSLFSIEEDVRLEPGQATQIAGYDYRFDGTRSVEGPNYSAIEGQITILKDGREVAVLHPQKRVYRSQPNNPMTEAGIDPSLTRDVFVALGEPRGDAGGWSLRLQYKPFVRWIWGGCLIMAIGGFLAASDRRYRVTARQAQAARASGVAPSTGAA
jgi:cytochrome c-type biogenesis protein CcmF